MRVLMIFIDGLGLGDNNADTNPLVRYGFNFCREVFGHSLTRDIDNIVTPERCLVQVDATLGIEGLPQSATGQAAILTGLNTARIMGRHIQAFPGPQLAEIICETNIMKQLGTTGLSATSANMYLPNYFELVAKRKRRHSAITLAILSAKEPLRSLIEIAAGQAVYQDITNEMIPMFGVTTIPVINPADAAQNLVNISRKYCFTIFEYFQTDRAGHKQDWDYAKIIIHNLDNFIATVYQQLPEDMLLIIVSDHGNFEDFSVKTHTLNKVPVIALGRCAQNVACSIKDLTHVAPAILSVLERMN